MNIFLVFSLSTYFMENAIDEEEMVSPEKNILLNTETAPYKLVILLNFLLRQVMETISRYTEINGDSDVILAMSRVSEKMVNRKSVVDWL